jgi:hypothetical protein
VIITVKRQWFTDNSTIGEMLINNVHECYTLERTIRKDVASLNGQKAAIPEGTYKLIIDFSTRFQNNMPHILDVPGYDGIRIHSGNTSKDTEGCILVGNSRMDDFVGESHIAFDKFFDLLKSELAKGEVLIQIS